MHCYYMLHKETWPNSKGEVSRVFVFCLSNVAFNHFRIHKDRSFHCDVCNVCLDKRLQGKHKCRPDSGHDECCICLEVIAYITFKGPPVFCDREIARGVYKQRGGRLKNKSTVREYLRR